MAILGTLLILPARSNAEKPIPVFVTQAGEKEIFDSTEAIGTLKAKESLSLMATVTETISRISFEDSERVEAGQILIEMTSSEEHALLEEAASTFSEAKRQYDRLKPLVDRGAAPIASLDEKRREFETAQARLQAIESRLEDRLIKAPFGGILGLRNVSLGALVSPGDVITTLDDDSSMKLDFTIPSVFLDSLSSGMEITAKSPAFENQTFSGKVASIDSRIDPLTRSIIVRALIPNSDHLLKPGLLMTVELKRNPRIAIAIPEGALVPYGSSNSVFVAEISNDKNPSKSLYTARKQPVVIGNRTRGEVEILSGISKGELVITHGTMDLRGGETLELTLVDDKNIEFTDKTTKSN